MREVLVIVTADPRTSDRALEALRMSVGVALAGNRVRMLLLERAEALAEPERHAFEGWTTAAEQLGALRSLGGEVLPGGSVVEAAAGADAVIRWNP